MKRLYRSAKERIFGGVCGGIGLFFGVDPTLIRLIWILFTLLSFGAGLIFYLLAWLIMSRNPNDKWK